MPLGAYHKGKSVSQIKSRLGISIGYVGLVPARRELALVADETLLLLERYEVLSLRNQFADIPLPETRLVHRSVAQLCRVAPSMDRFCKYLEIVTVDFGLFQHVSRGCLP